ncbi:hypothetical protein BDP27DRAFT_1384656 [Rhodocollybia butyracea]|uniref:Uncharacterized protein n=1 Tax=Rhodocollybia butyracea TaxID=206335 RepID=A0A9P5PG17_9AGAR|nr:hypothetical protein BDP27DRAFT_1384656 [Rhodocollybia butyracea]
MLFSWAPHALYTKLPLLVLCLISLLLVSRTSSSSLFSLRISSLGSFSFGKTGKWTYSPRTNKTALVNSEDALIFAGFEGCASSREFYWHLASDKQGQWDRFPVVDSWKWDLENTGCDLRDLETHKEEMVRDLVEKGGWLILGDSITEGHFFSISCSLYPHVIATPDYLENPFFDRAWPQNIYLNPNSFLVQSLKFPPGFNITQTPLITFRRIDLLLSTEELAQFHKTRHSEEDGFVLFSEEAVWSLSPSYYLPEIFFSPLPQGNYAHLIASTAGHWTTTLFSGFANDTKDGIERYGEGIDGLIGFFGEATEMWANTVQEAIENDSEGVVLAGGRRARRQAIVRPYLTGHEDCHDYRQPWTNIEPFKWDWYNWGSIWKFNQVFETLLSGSRYADIHYVAIERPARLRPDAHATSDCLHIMAGAGVLEGWTNYIWHFVTREISGSKPFWLAIGGKGANEDSNK